MGLKMTNLICEATLNELIEQVGDELVETLMVELAEDAGTRVQNMQILLKNQQMDDLRKEAHTLKSSVGTMGLKTLSEQAGIIERTLVAGTGPDISPLVPPLTDLLADSLSEANRWLATR
jgi:HPt (histidine-containing phosphotransfer) domain-containing protein